MKWDKKNLGLLALFGTVALAPHAVHAGDGFYIGIFGGYNRLDDQDYKFYDDDQVLGAGLNPPASGDVITEVESDDDWMGGLTLGYASGALRPELELTYRSNDVDTQRENYLVGVLGTPLNAEAPTKGVSTIGYSAMANLWIDFLKSSSNFHPYLGGGLGAVSFEQKDPTYAGVERDGRRSRTQPANGDESAGEQRGRAGPVGSRMRCEVPAPASRGGVFLVVATDALRLGSATMTSHALCAIPNG